MDDPVSALDARIRKKVIQNCLLSYLKGKTRILITHSIDFLSQADKIIIMNEGKIADYGSYSTLKENSKFKNLLKINEINRKEASLEEGLTKDTSNGSLDSDCEAIKVEELMKNEKIVDPTLLNINSTKSVISEESKIERFETLGDYSKQKDGQIIEEDSDDDIEVEKKSYYKLFNIQGGFKMLFLSQFGMCMIEYFNRNNEHNEKEFSHNTTT